MKVVVLKNISYRYSLPDGGERTALEGLSLEVREGERLVVLGASGAGKTTLSLIMAGLREPSSGRVIRETGEPGEGPCHGVTSAGLVTQNPEDSFTSPLVREEVGLTLENAGVGDEEISRSVDEILQAVGLREYADTQPSLLSGGQKQLLAVASVLIAEPSLLLLDEPLSLLDCHGREEVAGLLAQASRRAGQSMVFFSSEIEDILRGDRVVVLSGGKPVFDGSPGDFPLDEPLLASWGLVLPDLNLLWRLLGRDAGEGKEIIWRPREMAEALCPSD
jgi:energy-coupling factor transport system ATP-binding protein